MGEPAAIKKVVKESAKTTRDVVKYDALIVAAAKFYGADVIVTYDADITKLGKLAKVKVCTPGDLLKGTTRPLFPDHA
ncbi:MAG: PIN domain-containing protein [Polyangiaceae bacterium]|nr:PIN domain-containing protein [Polyangiaceae bacterium]